MHILPTGFIAASALICHIARADEPFKRWSVALDPLAVLGQVEPTGIRGRITGRLEVSPVRHHAFVIEPSVRIPGMTWWRDGYDLHGWDGRVGYRYYIGHHGLQGFFVGGSAQLGRTVITSEDQGSAAAVRYGGYWQAGGLAEVGYHHVFSSGFTLGIGASAVYQVQFATDELYAGDRERWQHAIRPQLTTALGWTW